MSAVERPAVGEPLQYKRYWITATLIGPDLLGQIDGQEMPHFYQTLHAVHEAGKKMIDTKIKEQEEKKHAKRRRDR